MLFVLCAYDVVLIGAILLLEWHYLVDIIAGVVVAATAIAITDSSGVRSGLLRADSETPVGEGTLSVG